MTETEERLSRLEERVAELDSLLLRVLTVANAHPVGRKILKMIGIAP